MGVTDNSAQVSTSFDANNVYFNWLGQNFTAGNVITASVQFASGADPIVLDLGQPGITFTTLDSGVNFDINSDGILDQMAWTTGEDGILAYDLDGSGRIENGTELFTPHFAGGHYADGLGALASLDANSDGKIDSADPSFSDLRVWQDRNHDGVSDAGELSTLTDHTITAISLGATPGHDAIDGQAVRAEGTFSFAGGGSSTYVVVDLEAALGTAPVDHASRSSNDILTGSAAVDTFVFKPNFGRDTIQDFTQGQDVIEIDHVIFADFAAVQAASAPSGSDMVIAQDIDNAITLANVAALQAQDFRFV